MTLHDMAVRIDEDGRGGRTRDGGGAVEGGDIVKKGGGGGGDAIDEENVDPQRMSLDGPGMSTSKTNTADSEDDDPIEGSTVANTDDHVSSAIRPHPPSSNNGSTMTVQITSGPHAPSRFHLRPRPGAPCLVGRSKGKKFVKNGISLHRDQEVSTTHGKFVVVVEGGEGGGGGGGPPGDGRPLTRYYFVDVGSTNGTVHDGALLVPNVRLTLADGMELKLGNSMLRIVLS